MAGEYYERFEGLDHSFLVLEGPSTHMHVAAALLFDASPLTGHGGGLDIDRIRAHVASRLHLLPRYRQRVAWIPLENHPVWVDDDHFNLDYHVRHTSLPRPGDDPQLKRLCARIMSQQLDRAKPLWELWVVEGLEDGRFALLAKTHHCMVDGLAGVDLLGLLLSPTREPSIEESPPFVPRPAPSGVELLRGEILRRVPSPFGLARAVSAALRAPERIGAELAGRALAIAETLSSGLRGSSPTPLNRPVGPHRRFDWLTLSLDDVREVKQRLGGTVNDVVLATVSGAVRSFLDRRRVDPGEISFRALTPVSVRSREDRRPSGNRISMWLVDLPVAEPDPAVRLEKIRETTSKLKESNQALGAKALVQATEWTGSTLLSLGVQLIERTRPFNLVVTNVPGPQVPLYLLGAELQSCFPVVPLWANQGLGVAIFSYRGALCWGFNADWDLLPDLAVFADGIAASFAELRSASRKQAAVKPARAVDEATAPAVETNA